jgi:hypothetical protein
MTIPDLAMTWDPVPSVDTRMTLFLSFLVNG